MLKNGRINNAAVTMERSGLFFEEKAQSLASALKGYSFLSGIPENAIEALADKARILSYPKNSLIISEGSAGNALYIILSGKTRVFTCDDEDTNKEIIIRLQGPGTYFGEISLLTDEPRSASVKAMERTVCAVISKDNFIHWLEDHPVAAIRLLTSLSKKIIELTEKLRRMTFKSVYKKIVLIFKELAVKEGERMVVYECPTQQELALMVGASREMVGKIMNELLKGGYVHKAPNGKSLFICKRFPLSW